MKQKYYSQQVTPLPKKSNGETMGIVAVEPLPEPTHPTILEGVRSKVFLDRYSWKDESGSAIEKYPEQMWGRVAKAIASVEKNTRLRKIWEEKFYYALSDFKFLPGGRILSGAGTGYEVTFYNCFVLPSPNDSRGGIIDNLKAMIEVMSRAGGVGINLSTLRPRGARVHKVNGTSSGPVNWASLYSTGTQDVIQQGGSRRGALMLMLHDWHPDVEEFIEVKKDLSRINGANLSVCISDNFMEAVEKDGDWVLRFPDTRYSGYDDIWDGDIHKWEAKGYSVKIYKTVKAREIWDNIAHAAWASAEPGVHFLERSNKWGNTWYFENLISTNPCGEQPLGPWAVCNLGALNLSAFVEDEKMNYEKLAQIAKIATRFLDNVVDANFYFYEENERQQRSIRRTGLGTMGLGDALIKMKIKYGSDASLPIIEEIYKTIRDAAYEASADLAAEKDPFPKFDKEKYFQGYFIKQLPNYVKAKIAKNGIRNAVILTQAPTGTTSLLAGVSSGIEPVYDFTLIRRDRTGEHVIYHPLYKQWKDAHPNDEMPGYFVAANDLTPDDHVKVQAMIQKYTDSSISKTVNAPNSHTVEQVKELYIKAYKLGCKGVTYMRDGSREGVLSHVDEKPTSGGNVPKQDQVGIQTRLAYRPAVLNGRTYKMLTPVGEAFITINRDDKGSPMEVFATIGKAGMQTGADAEAIGRLISLSLRIADGNRIEVAKKIISQLRGIGGSSQVGFGKNRVMSLADAIAQVLAEEISQAATQDPQALPLETEYDVASTTNGIDDETQMQQLEISGVQSSTMITSGDLCPECGESTFVLEEGCSKCYSCGYSKC